MDTEKYTEQFWNDRTARMMVGIEWERLYDARNWCSKIPYLPFKQGWLIKIIPPFAGAVARFLVSKGDNVEKYVSVYLDCYSQLGIHESPYWEVYPYNGDTFRCDMNEVNSLIDAIECSLNEINNEE